VDDGADDNGAGKRQPVGEPGEKLVCKLKFHRQPTLVQIPVVAHRQRRFLIAGLFAR
jgi:hypothetical protein